jgi:tRNA(Ile)-lysidine synthase
MATARTFLTRFHEYCRRRQLLVERDRVIVAVSGGVDSSVLLDLLARERPVLRLEILVAHFNHRLRGVESDGDEVFVVERARQLGIECFVERADTGQIADQSGTGIQETARKLRYDFFERLLVSTGFAKIATGHNADDNAETVLLNMIRGAGVQGLAGIPVFRRDPGVIRPLLFAPRPEIERYALEEGITSRQDSSNAKNDYARNLLRHNILPIIQERLNPSVVQTLLRSAELFRELEVYLQHQARACLDLVMTAHSGAEVHLSIPKMRSTPVLLQQYVVLLVGEDLTKKQLESDHVAAALGQMNGMTGSWVELGEGYVVYRDRESLVFRRCTAHRDFHIMVRTDQRYELSGFKFSSALMDRPPGIVPNGEGAEYVDADRVGPGELVLRTWKEGDVFVPLGMTAPKKLSDFFIDAKVPLFEKRSFPILETRGGEIVWVCGQRIDDRFKITEGTRRVLKLEFARFPEESDAEVPQSAR